MKLSFSTKGYKNTSFHTFVNHAKELGYQGIELHDLNDITFFGGYIYDDANTAKKAMREAFDNDISLCMIDSTCDISKYETPNVQEELAKTITLAKTMHVPYVRIHAMTSCEDAKLLSILEQIVEIAKKEKITLLLETTGIFADTKKLRVILGQIASDHLAALYDVQHPYRMFHESPEESVKNLGAFVKHVHMHDSSVIDNVVTPQLLGEGTLPLDEVMHALRSINYDGFISFEWDTEWMPEMTEIDVLLAHFAARMSSFDDPSTLKVPLYYNNRNTGRFVWKKDTLIDCTFSQMLDKMVEEFPDQLAFRYTTLDYQRTYTQFRDDVDQFARALVSLGVKAGSHVAVWCTNVPQWFITFWATVKIGAVLVTVNTAYKSHEAEYLLSQSDTHTLVMMDGFRDSNYSEIVQHLCPELEETKKGEPLRSKKLPFLRNVITIGFNMKGCLTFEETLQRASLVSQEEILRMASKVRTGDVCNMQYTSGTTGFPKGVMLTHYNIVNNGKNIGDRMDLSTADRMMIQVPMFHCFGMVLAMTACMTHGSSMYPLPYYSPRPALACIHNEKITAVHGVPTMFIALLENENFEKTDFSFMRTGIMAGSPCPVKVMQDVQTKMNMKEITIVYGQTEASPGCTMSETTDPLEVRVGTVGRALPEIECRIVDPNTNETMPDNEIGEFVARGYNIMKGYYKMPKATLSAIDSEGWLHTGDLALRTPEGNYRITGRLKDMIIRGGENIYPKEIEEFIYTHPKVKDVQVIGIPDVQYGEEIMAVIVLKDGESMTQEEMKQFITEHMARHKVPKYIDFTDAFPMNVAGKILKYKMREDAIKKLGLENASKVVTA